MYLQCCSLRKIIKFLKFNFKKYCFLQFDKETLNIFDNIICKMLSSLIVLDFPLVHSLWLYTLHHLKRYYHYLLKLDLLVALHPVSY